MSEAPEHEDSESDEMLQLKQQLFRTDETVTRIAVSAARLEGDMFEVKRDVAELKGLNVKFDRFQTVLDGMVRQLQSFDRWCRSQGSILMEHEQRLTKLESKPQ